MIRLSTYLKYSARRGITGIVALLGGIGCVSAQENPTALPGKPSWRVAPTAAIDVTYTDNVSPGKGDKKSAWITRLSPGVSVSGESAIAKGSLALSIQQSLYSGNKSLDSTQTSFRGDGQLELVEKWLFLDASGNIAQRPISAFGTQGAIFIPLGPRPV